MADPNSKKTPRVKTAREIQAEHAAKDLIASSQIEAEKILGNATSGKKPRRRGKKR